MFRNVKECKLKFEVLRELSAEGREGIKNKGRLMDKRPF